MVRKTRRGLLESLTIAGSVAIAGCAVTGGGGSGATDASNDSPTNGRSRDGSAPDLPSGTPDGWHMPGYDETQSSVATEFEGPSTPPEHIWKLETDGEPVSGPIVVDGTIYAAAGPENFTARDTLYALDAVDGSELWTTAWGDTINGAPAYDDSTLYVGRHKYLSALDPSDGSERWSHSMGTVRQATPVPTSNAVYTGDGMGTFFALRPESGEEIWFQMTDDVFSGSAAVTDDRIIIPTERSLYCFDNTDGTLLWETPEARMYTRPCLGDGAAFSTASDSTTVALDLTDGARRWEVDISGATQPAVVDETLYVGGTDGIYAIDTESGRQRWHTTYSPTVVRTVVGAGSTLYAGTYDHVVALDMSNGEERWRVRTNGPVNTLAISNHWLYYGTPEDGLHAMAEPDG